MTVYSGYIRMMEHEGTTPVRYRWSYANYQDEADKKRPGKSEAIESFSSEFLNDFLGKKLKLTSNGKIRCLDCGKPTKKSFNQGSCFECFSNKANNDLCIMRPETCHFHKGTCREPEWGKKYCFQEHTVYFANSSGLKVGITKEKPVSNRWVDQGARFGIPLLTVSSRREAGIIEHYLAGFLPDKTSWQKMIQGDPPEINLTKERDKFVRHLETKEFPMENEKGKTVLLNWNRTNIDSPQEIQYPILSYPKKVKSYKLSETDSIEDVLVGIKGQYLLFENGAINIRSYGGYHVVFEVK
ncbi:DUF2797 domain-containing protein [Leptospira idonii]|uniref:DUF2797 domain-containing protein n=1 Tax=Leptospira idonii TaxID=1193500 RepID=A0A4R9LX92_9LEPT|nr:DUF2797 domain-containing protein [Leptospira idonii]TGN18161.1 DUF2797 domain-containing protein [Leptospira idonii]